jgi:hypothetical protein
MAKGKRKISSRNKVLTKRRKRVFISSAAVIICVIFVFKIITDRNRKILDVAYYRLPPVVTDALTEQIKKSYSGKIYFKIFSGNEQLKQKKVRKYDLFFTWNGAQAEAFAAKSVDLPSSLYDLIPDSERSLGIASGKNRMLPLLYDHYEISFLKETAGKTEGIPEDWDSFEKYLQKNTGGTRMPLFAAGADDRTLLAFTGALAEAIAGVQSYKRLVQFAGEGESPDIIMDESLETSNDGKTSVTLRTILNLIVSWQKSGIMHQTWFNGSETDTSSFMKDKNAAAVFMPLSEHRTLPLRTVYPYETSHFPVASAVPDHALIAPAVVLISYTKNPLFTDTIKFLISVQSQEALSNLTQLAPASSRAGAYDKQADDVRFWAAAYSGGPVPDLMNAAFTSDAEAYKFAAYIRKYLGK